MVPFVDHHCHGLARGWRRAGATGGAAPFPAWRRCFTESSSERVLERDVPQLLGYRHFLAAIAPLIGTEDGREAAVVAARDRLAAADPPAYLRRLLDDAGVAALLVDTGFGGPDALTPAELAAAAGRPVHEIVRIESVAEALLAEGGAATRDLGRFTEAFEARLAAALDRGAVALKSALAYRSGLRLPAREAGDRGAERAFADLDRAAQARRLDDPVLGPHLLWRAAELAAARGVPLQVHTGFGDEDLDLASADPALLRPLLRDPRTEGCPPVLLHCYPFVGAAAYLAGTYPQVYLDLSLALPLAEPVAARLVREALGLCPASKLLAASDGHSFPEMHWWGATVWRRALAEALRDEDEETAAAVARQVLGGNARRLYRLDDLTAGRAGAAASPATGP